ncbi:MULTISPECIES: hypothetical protein [unclassified Paenibacillus]|uniref:hypothetical protein n=1 Tax=unclassified Paenibacillus TaxID=185978 RepID=UPI003F7F85BA
MNKYTQYATYSPVSRLTFQCFADSPSTECRKKVKILNGSRLHDHDYSYLIYHIFGFDSGRSSVSIRFGTRDALGRVCHGRQVSREIPAIDAFRLLDPDRHSHFGSVHCHE